MRTLEEAAAYLTSLGFFARVRSRLSSRELTVGSPLRTSAANSEFQVIPDASHIEEVVEGSSYRVSLCSETGIDYEQYDDSLDSLMERVVAHYVMRS